MEVLVDADACPVKDIIITVAKKHNIPVTMIIDTSHELSCDYSKIITVDKARDSVDIALINLVKPGDIVVTQDFGVAALALGKGAKAINQNGLIYTDSNMDKLLFERYLGGKVRRSGGKTAGIKKRTKSDDENFEKAFKSLIE